MKKIYLLALLSPLFFTALAQFPGGGGARPGAGGQVPTIGHFYGKVVDSKTGKAMDGASVQLLKSKFDTASKKTVDAGVAGIITGKNGQFSFENLAIFGNYKLRITAIGYTTYEQKLSFNMKFDRTAMQNGDMSQALNGVDRDLGNIKVEASSGQTLGEVTVTASKPLISLGVDRKVYNVAKDISAPGGSGVDVMRNIPSVAVDIDGNVTLRNSTPTIFVDGLPSTLTLDQIPADLIESVEIITNPGAKYDASGGTAGILNIILKKNRRAGYNGNVRAGVDDRGKFNIGGDINAKQGKFNVFINANVNQRESIAQGTTYRYTFQQNPFDSLQQYSNNVNQGLLYFARAGVDYFMDNRNTFSIAGNLFHGSFTPYITSDIYVDTLYPLGTKSSYTQQISNTSGTFYNHGAMLSYKHIFPKAGEEWTANGNYSTGGNSNNNTVESNVHNQKGGPLTDQYTQKQVGSGVNTYITAQTDFTNPISEKSKLDAGVRAAFRSNSSINNYYSIYDSVIAPLNLLNSNYTYHDQVLAGYVQYSNTIKQFAYQVGLRAESSKYNGSSDYFVVDTPSTILKDTSSTFSNSYPLSLFPSVFLTQKLGGNQELQLSFTRRIDRPSFFQLFPFVNFADSLNIQKGNPNLKPQFTSSFELSYQKTFPGDNVFIGSVYYKYTTNLITRYQIPGVNPITDSLLIINTFINANSAFVGGLELIGRNAITKWYDLTSNINVYTSKINAGDTLSVGQTWSMYAKVNNTFKISKKLTLQVTADYTTKSTLPPGGTLASGSATGGGGGFGGTVSGNAQGYSKPTGGLDASLRYTFLKNNTASLTLSCQDILRTRVNDVVTETNYFTQEVIRRRDPQLFRLQFNWRFGKFDASLFKRKNTKADQDLQNGAQGGGMQQ
jgi:outer membrane receptor protein involved in Fe transport